MQLTDQEVREIILRNKKKKKRRKRVIRRVSILVFALIAIIVGVTLLVRIITTEDPRGTVFIDPGHGGMDSGSYVGNRMEKDDTLKLSLKVKEELENLGFTVYMSRETDEYIESKDRCELANSKNANLFVSIHRNKADEGNGVEIYTPSKNDTESQTLGNNIFNALVKQGFYPREVKLGTLITPKEDYTENELTKMPSCLVEVGFIQDSSDNKIFDDKLDENALAIATAICDTFAKLYEPADIE